MALLALLALLWWGTPSDFQPRSTAAKRTAPSHRAKWHSAGTPKVRLESLTYRLINDSPSLAMLNDWVDQAACVKTLEEFDAYLRR